MIRILKLAGLALVAAALLIGPSLVLAQDGAPAAPTDWLGMLPAVIVAAVPLVVAGIKKKLATWLIPILATFLGVAADFLAAYALNKPVTPMLGAIFGLAGVGLREIVDQLRKATG